MPKGLDQCPYKVDEILDDLLETEHLLKWHSRIGNEEKPTMSHYNMNYHSKAFEQAEHYLRNTLDVLSSPTESFSK